MGKCVPPPTTEAAPCLTLRSGRRVLPVAASSVSGCRPRTTSGRPRRHRGSSALRCCAAAEGATKKSACRGSPRRRNAAAHAAAGRPPPSRRVLGSQQLCDDDGRGDNFERPKTPPLVMTDDSDVAVAKHLNESRRCHSVVVGQTPPSRPPPPTEADMEAFFAAAELAERRRFTEAYNYDVALDRPLEGRFEWTPVST